MKIILWTIAAVLGISLFGIAIRVVFFPINTVSKIVDTAYEAQNKTINADNAIYNYEWFKQQYQDIEATKVKLDNAKLSEQSFKESAGERSYWTFEDKNESARLSSVVLGIENVLAQQIADYNARSSMANRAIFQDGILPSFIESLTFLK